MEKQEKKQDSMVSDIFAIAMICIGFAMLYLLLGRKKGKSMDEMTIDEIIELRKQMEREEKYELCQKLTDILEKKRN